MGNSTILVLKESGQTPYSQSRDGRLTLKGGLREVLAAEALYYAGVKTSRCLCLIETEAFTRDGETVRGAVMVRFSRSHLRFGTFERLDYYGSPRSNSEAIKSCNSILRTSFVAARQDCHISFYGELVKRIAQLVAQWMAVGFCHGVLNTDNMSITGESFDYRYLWFYRYLQALFYSCCF